jgi:protein SCO1/2
VPDPSRRAAGRRGLLVLPAVLLALLVTGCSTGSDGEFSGIRLDTPYEVPADVTLTDTDGEAYSLADDTDKPLTLVFFGYTHCPDYCPAVMGSIAASMNRLSDEDRDEVDVVFVTTDPARDDEAALRDYLDRFDSEFVGLTGELTSIVALGDPLAIYVADGKELATGGYDLGGHTTATLAIDENDEAVALWKQGTSAVEYAEDIHALLAED